MKPIRLEMNAFGPYAGQTVLDFEQLGENRLFLICGPTGAGKSTILDAMSYALYGKTSGDERTGTDLRSDYADEVVRTEVTFDFAVGDRLYRICRSPSQMLRRKLKSGSLTKPAEHAMKSELYKWDGEGWDPITAKNTAVEAEKILGVGVAQFRQIILLPQGQFRKLLLADSKERQAIMQQLFHTEIYARLEDAIRKKVSGLEAARKESEERKKGFLSACGVDREEALPAVVAAAEQEAQAAQSAYAAADKEETAFLKAYEEASRLDGAWTRLEKAQAASARLAGDKPAMDELTRRVDRIAAAARLKDACDNLEQIRQDGQRRAGDLERTRARADQCRRADARAKAEAAAFEAERPVQQKRLEELADLNRMPELAAAYQKAKADYAAAERAWKKASADRTLAERAEAAAREARDTARQDANAYETAFLHGQAAHLAASLEEGKPCPVCGSVHHPSPAGASGDKVPDESQVEKKRAEASAAEARSEKAARALEAARQEESAWAVKHAACAAALEEKGRQVPEAYRAPGAAERRIRTLQQESDAFALREKTVQAAQQKAAEDLTAAEKEAELTSADVARLRQQYQEAREALLTRAKDAGFADLAEFQPYFQDIRREKEFRQVLVNYEAQVKAEAKKAEDEKAAIAGAARPDMAEWNRRRDETGRRTREALEKKTQAGEQLKRLRQAEEEVKNILADQAKTDEAYRLATRLEILFRGKENGVNLERFVLGALLDDVLRKANLRLAGMSGGRYELSRQGVREDKRKQSGLDLDVFDSYTGHSRPANTLSGGESFLAALSLALGLADVVQEYAGGIRLDAMFIDEGFGTLDSESLDLALKTLTELQSADRLVGIISHVGELEERIPAKLRIKKSDCGSSAAFEIRV